MRKTCSLTFTAASLLLLTACTTMHDKLADMAMQTKKLPDGSTVHVGMNITPTAKWNCKKLGATPGESWSLMQTKAMFTKGGAIGMLTSNALDYANEHHSKVNYVNLNIPTESTFTHKKGNFSDSTILNSGAEAYADLYRCQLINPDHHIGNRKYKDVSIEFK